MAQPLSKKVHQTASQMLNDPIFATKMQRLALEAVKGGTKSEAWKEYFEMFASTPGELSELGVEYGANCTCQSTTYMTISSMVTPIPTCCNTTTTTTTSGNYFGV